MSEKTIGKAEEIADDALDVVVGGAGALGQSINGPLKAKVATFIYDEDGGLERKILLASASGAGNVLGGGGTAPREYTFDEVIDAEFVPVTYRVD